MKEKFSFARLFQRSAKTLPASLGLMWGMTCMLSAQTPQRPQILGISHVGILAHDYEASRAFYGQFLGFQEPYSLKNPDGTPMMTFFKVNDKQAIELYPEKEANTDRVTHVSLYVSDIEAIRVYLKSKGVEVPDQAHTARIGNRSFDVIDPEGHKVELVQYMPEGKTAQAYGKFTSDTQVSKHMTHFGIIVTKLEPELRFYEDILGFKETWRGSSSGTTLSWVNLKVPDGSDYIEFMLYKEAPDATHRGAAHHICLQVPSVAASVEKLEAEPYFKTTYKRDIVQKVGVNRKRQANLYDPDGTRTELMEADTVDGKPTPPSSAPFPE